MNSEKLQSLLLNLQFRPISEFPWRADHSAPAGVVLLYPGGRVILVGHDIQGTTSAHFVGGNPWIDEFNQNPGIKWAWIFNE